MSAQCVILHGSLGRATGVSDGVTLNGVFENPEGTCSRVVPGDIQSDWSATHRDVHAAHHGLCRTTTVPARFTARPARVMAS